MITNFKMFEKKNNIIFDIDIDYIYNNIDNRLDIYKTENISEIKMLLLNDSQKFLNNIFKNTLNIYRKMIVRQDYVDKLLNGEIVDVGKYWSYNKNKSECWHHNHNNVELNKEILFNGKVKWEDINLNDTLVLYFIFYKNESESEIVLKTDTKITLKSVEIDCENIKINTNIKYPMGSFEQIP